MTQVLNYHDAVMYDSDMDLFGEGGWLNDNCINWFFKYLEHEIFQEDSDILFIDPAVVSCMVHQCDEPGEFVDLGKGIGLDAKRVVFVPINNASHRLARGTHWSLLVFERIGEGSSHFRHYDSSRGFNRHPAERTASQFVCMLAEDAKSPDVEHISDAPQQDNGYDCGMYTVLIAEHLASKAVMAGASKSGAGEPVPDAADGGKERALADNMTPAFVSKARVLAKERLLQCIQAQQGGDATPR